MFPLFICISAEGACPDKLTDIRRTTGQINVAACTYVCIHAHVNQRTDFADVQS